MTYFPHSDADRKRMLESVGVEDVLDLYADVPASLLLDEPLSLPEPLSEWEVVRQLRRLSEADPPLVSFAGGGIYDHHVPAAVDHLIRRSEFYTAYTPYQPEVSQGTLQAIYEFQTMVCELTGMEAANASMYDGATATGEAVLMSRSVTGRDRVVVSHALHPHYRKVVETYLSGADRSVERVSLTDLGATDPESLAGTLDEDVACVVVQNPNFLGVLEELPALAATTHEVGALLVVVADPVTLALLRSPGECGADIVVGEGQALGSSMSFGGPALGLFASRQRYVRRMPGRIVGATVDEEGRRGYVLTLQTREQQIRRERATSNICTNQGLNMLAATIHLALVGREGLERIAEASLQNAHYAMRRLQEVDGVRPLYPDSPFFREFAVITEEDSRSVLERGIARGILPGISLSRFPEMGLPDGLLLAFTEKRDRAEIDRLIDLLNPR